MSKALDRSSDIAAVRWGGVGVIKTGYNLVGKGEEGGGGGAVPSESMLGVRRLLVVGEAGE